MITTTCFSYQPNDSEREAASNSYLMSLIAIIAGLPMPIINLIATLAFYLSNRKSAYFVRWHCTQALLSQATLLFINVAAFWWTFSIVFGDVIATNKFFAYLMAVFIFNLVEFIVTIYTAVQSRKGIHVEWWFFGSLTNLITTP